MPELMIAQSDWNHSLRSDEVQLPRVSQPVCVFRVEKKKSR